MHKIIREHIDMNFERTHDPLRDMGVGMIAQIDIFLDKIGLEKDEYIIKDNLKIDVFGDVNLTKLGLEELPEYVDFDIIYGGFYAGGNPWQSLKGFPREISGDLQINSPSNFIEMGKVSSAINEKTIKKLIKVHGKIWV